MTGILAPLRGIKNHLLNVTDIPGDPANLRLFTNGEQVGAGIIKKQVSGRDGVGRLVSSI